MFGWGVVLRLTRLLSAPRTAVYHHWRPLPTLSKLHGQGLATPMSPAMPAT
jgi:hypothetical protein